MSSFSHLLTSMLTARIEISPGEGVTSERKGWPTAGSDASCRRAVLKTPQATQMPAAGKSPPHAIEASAPILSGCGDVRFDVRGEPLLAALRATPKHMALARLRGDALL